MTAPFLYPFPAELAAIPRDRSAAIEASAGTGKTHLIEHLVVDRVLRGDARLDQILVVTFTERAAAELIRRIRALITRVLHFEAPPELSASPDQAWTIDQAARARLEDAAGALDLAPVSTIHAFCHGVLTEHAFAGGRLLAQANVESRTAFARAFAEALRMRLATDPELTPYLEAWLAESDLRALETLLYKARQLRCDWSMSFIPEALAGAAGAYAALPLESIDRTVRAAIKNAASVKAMVERLRLLREATVAFVADGDALRLLARIDDLVRAPKDLFNWAEDRLGGARANPAVADLLALLADLAAAAVPLETAVAQKLGPVVEARLQARKRAQGQHDFDDMLTLVHAALAGPEGAGLVAALRARYRLAVIDEFQDTDPIQWEIFRTIFHASDGANPLYVIGDPKQSIYGFRGADLATYNAARNVIAPGDEVVRLSLNYRSSKAVIDGYNAILDGEADPRFFNEGIDYHPVACGRPDAIADDAPPMVLLRVSADQEEEKLAMRAVRAELVSAIAEEIAALRARPDGPPAREIFVLTRTRRESEAIAAALAGRAIPHVLYNQEGLYETEEARHVRDLLRAIEDPRDPEKRLRAWLTPFFGLTLAELPAAAAGAEPGLVDRLVDWHGAAASGELGRLLARVLDESGVIRRELFGGESLRRLVNYQHLFEVLTSDGARQAQPLGEIVRRLSALVAKIVIPNPEEGNQLRIEGERDAVQIMTMHRAKGLEADVAFLYGGFGPGPNDRVRAYVEGTRRLRLAGRPRRAEVTDLVKRERNSEDQRLLYVALTRARRRLYLPYSGKVPESDAGFDASDREEFWKLTGGYRHLNGRLRALVHDPAVRPLFLDREVPVRADDAGAAPLAAALADWRPAPADLVELAPDAELARLRRARAGTVVTSYSRIKQAHGGYRPPKELLDEPVAVAPTPSAEPEPDGLPGGARAGIFIHELLEKIDLGTLRETPDAESWAARPDIQALLESLLRKHARDPRHLAAAARLAHAALTAPLPVVGAPGGALGGTLPGLIAATREVRELEFLFPFPEAAGGADRGFVKGFVDVLFEHEGRTYFGDWKTDQLPGWDPELVAAHVDANYALQEQLYSLALVRMLGITDEASHEARFGGTIYLFVRGLPAAIRARRPSFLDIQRWQAELGDTLSPGPVEINEAR